MSKISGEPSAQKRVKTLSIFQNGIVSAHDPWDYPVTLKSWLTVYLEYLESEGIDPEDIEDSKWKRCPPKAF